MNFAQALIDCPAPDEKIALLTQKRHVTFGQLRDAARRIAVFWKRRGLKPGDRVLLAGESSAFWVQSYLGTALAGGVGVPLPATSASGFFASAVASTQPRFACVQAKCLRRLHTALTDCEAVLSDARPPRLALEFDLTTVDELPKTTDGSEHPAAANDLAVIMYTSGSTGQPQGVMVSHENILVNSQDIIASMDIGPNDRIMAVLPFHYCFGVSLLHTHLMTGASLVIDNRFLYPEKVLQNMLQSQCTSLAGVPSTYQILLRRSNLKSMELPRLRKLQQAGGKLAEPFIAELEAALPQARLFVMYGQTEATARLSCISPEDRRAHPGSIGKGLPNANLQVIGPDKKLVTPGQVGQILATGKSVALGYWRDPESTRRVFDGGLHTGDLATVDDHGFVKIVGRANDFLKCGGKRVSARQIEETLLHFSEMTEAAVVSIPDDVLGEAVCLFAVHPAGAAIEAQLVTFCQQQLDPTLLPKKIVYLDTLPRNNSGKVDKLALKETLECNLLTAAIPTRGGVRTSGDWGLASVFTADAHR